MLEERLKAANEESSSQQAQLTQKDKVIKTLEAQLESKSR